MSFLFIIIFFLQSILFGLIGSRFLRNTELREYRSFHKIAGIILVFFPVYLFCYSLNISSMIVYPLLMFIYALGIFALKFDRNDLIKVLRHEVLFGIYFFSVLGLYAFGPRLDFGEKPMDLGLLSYFSKFPNLPAKDHWLALENFSYYDFGYFIFGNMTGTINISLEWKYYFALSFTASLALAFVYGILDYIKGRRVIHFLIAPLFLLLTPFSVLSFFSESVSASLFWNFTRVFENGLFFEFPLWSFLFSDLHPHVMMIPFSIASLFFAVNYFLIPKRKEFLILWLSSSLVLILGNTWDFLWGTIFTFPFFVALAWANKDALKNKALYVGVFFCVLININFVLTGKFASTDGKSFFNVEFLNFGLMPFFKSFGVSFLLFLIASFLWIRRDRIKGMSYLAAGLWAIVALSFIILNDRLNSIFKGGSYLYLLLTLSSLIIIYNFSNLKKMSIILLYSAVSIILCTTSWMGFRHKNSSFSLAKIENNFSNNQKELLSYLRDQDANYTLFTPYLKTYDYKSIEFLSFTGVPLVMGWDNHLFVRGKEWTKLKEIERDMNQFYTSPSLDKADELFDKYKMKAIYFPEGSSHLDLKYGVLLEKD